MPDMLKGPSNKTMSVPLNKYHQLLQDTLDGQVQGANKGLSTFKINQTLSLTDVEIKKLYGLEGYTNEHFGVAKKWLKDELELYMSGETDESKYKEKGIDWWDYCAPTLINTYPTYFAKLPALIEQMNKEKRHSKNYVLFIGQTGVETNQLPCLSLIQFQIIKDCWGEQKLHMTVFQRSADASLGLISDMYQMYLISKKIEVSLGSITFFIGNCHIYNNNIELTKEMLKDKSNGDYSKKYNFILNT
jgi:thymidylate synthase